MANSAANSGLPSAELWASHNKMVMEPLDSNDPEVHSIIKKEKQRQRLGLELIASENFASRAVLEALGSCLNNKYSEGYPGQRYYGGTEFVDELERLCQKRALQAYRLDPQKWGVNVQPYSGNGAVGRARLGCAIPTPVTAPVCSHRRVPRQLRRVHGLGGASRQDHGAGPARRGAPDARVHDGEEEDLCHLCLLRVHALQGQPQDGLHRLRPPGGERPPVPPQADHSRRQLLLAQPGLRPHAEDRRRQRRLPHGRHGPHQRAGGRRRRVLALRPLRRRLHHHAQDPAGLQGRHDLLPQRHPQRGPQDGQGNALQPGEPHQPGGLPRAAGGPAQPRHRRYTAPGWLPGLALAVPHIPTSSPEDPPTTFGSPPELSPPPPPPPRPGLCLPAGIAVALRQAMTPEFKAYQQQVVANCRALSAALMELGYDIVTGGSDNHLILLDLRSRGTDGGRAERVLELCSIACNKNTCPGDVSALRPSGLRFGTPALTSRGFQQDDFRMVAQYIHRGIELTLRVQSDMSPKATLKEFKEKLEEEQYQKELKALKVEVEAFAATFPLPGLPVL
ncbi:serine hydroxymethyltransferase, cytosolic isoform X3 [Cygnus atratus]|uniref:serine hydroxymethyltransferase, cytosolic isoform X3 n=1 Tax=Cygnus atratus TaxID=8868 RepID=UPI0015D5E64C|nr:serine hydroxymethyltransferase, cytosolic isoform X3 [Cygnus atratus]